MDDYFDILFEPVQIGPVTAPNRFYQVPHCNGLGYRMPQALAAMRASKAEGGWGVVCTEEVEIHHTSDVSPYVEGRLWDDADIPAMRLVTDAIHAHGALAGIELTHSGLEATNFYSRVPPLGPRSMSIIMGYSPIQTRRMDREDIRNVRRWHRDAAVRAKQAGFDIVYCYAGHDLSLAMQFMLRRYNDRTDEYGGPLENRIRLFRELIEETKDAIGDTCAVAVRFAVEELLGENGLTSQNEGHDIVAMLAELPDLWDVNISDWSNDSATSRFEKEGFQEAHIAFVKSLTSKPVVGVGRYTSPQSMVSAVQRGIVDLIGAARPSIADPFLPRKIRERRFEDIRECIGCNICVTGDTHVFPIRCTQNPTMGEVWRRGWHPEKMAPRKSTKEILVVGGGPAGLECARALGQRGYSVSLVEARRTFGGRVALEAQLPGLIEWRRVIDWRLAQIAKMPHVTLYPESDVSVADVLEAGYRHVIVATGATWRRDGVGRGQWAPIPGHAAPHVLTADDILAGQRPLGRVVVYDNDHFYLGGLIAEALANAGSDVSLVTPAPLVSIWTEHTLEQEKIQQRLMRLGVPLHTQQSLLEIQQTQVTLAHTVSGALSHLDCDGVVLLTDRLPHDRLYRDLKPHVASGALATLSVIGDADAPGIIASAVFAGHLAARSFDEPAVVGTPFKVERVAVAGWGN